MAGVRCRNCGCGQSAHADDGCHGVQHLTPWDTEACTCQRFRGPKEGPPVKLEFHSPKEPS